MQENSNSEKFYTKSFHIHKIYKFLSTCGRNYGIRTAGRKKPQTIICWYLNVFWRDIFRICKKTLIQKNLILNHSVYTKFANFYRLVGDTTEFVRQLGKNLWSIYIDNWVIFDMTYSEYARKLQLRKILY
jgi:hypothetical protein